jgi:type IV pilus assembly protein PilW
MNTKFSFIRLKRGFSLVELMIAMVLGLFLIGGVVSVFLANRQVYRQNESLARMQENARYTFEVVARDVREAGGITCGSNLTPTNTVPNASDNWWSSWEDGTNDINGIRGFEAKENDDDFPKAFGTAATSRVEGDDDGTPPTPDALIIQSAVGNPFFITAHDRTTNHKFTLNTEDHGFSVNQVVMACDYSQAALFKISGVDDEHIEHTSTVLQTVPAFQSGGQLTLLSANAWYIGFNGRGGKSLYRLSVGGISEEIAEGVTDMQIMYLEATGKESSGNWILPVDYIEADSVTHWNQVVAVRIVFTLSSLETVGTDNAALIRTWNTVVTLRNHQI